MPGAAVPLATRAERERAVLAQAGDFALGLADSQPQCLLLAHALDGLRAGVAARAVEPYFTCLAPLVYAGVRGDERPAYPLAAAMTLLALGIDLLDDLADGDLPPRWAGYRPAAITLAAGTLFAALPQLAVAALVAPAETCAAMQRTLAQGLLRMAAGQHADLAMANGADAAPEAVEASVTGKSGEARAAAAALAAQFAGAPAAAVAAYARLGRALGTAAQLASDCCDLFVSAHSRDLASGTRTLPIALHLARLGGGERTSFLALLDVARADAEAGVRVREALLASGALWRCAFTVELHCQRAYRALEEAAPLEPARSALRGYIASHSVWGEGA